MQVFEVTQLDEALPNWLNSFIAGSATGGSAVGRENSPYEGIRFIQRRRGIELQFPDGSKRVLRTTNRDAIDSAVSDYNTRTGRRIEPRVTSDRPNQGSRPGTTPTDPELRADPRDRSGSSNRRTSSSSRNPSPAARRTGEEERPGRIRRWLGRLSGSTFLTLGYALVTIEQLTSYLEGYIEVLERPEINFNQEHPDARRAYIELRDQTVASIISTIGQVGLTVAWVTGFIRIASRFTGPIGWIIGFVIGAGASYAMDWLSNKIASDTGFAAWLSEQLIFRHVLSRSSLESYAQAYDKFKDGITGSNESTEDEGDAAQVTDPPIGQGTPDLEDLVRDWYQNDPEFRQGVDRARESGEAITPRNAIAAIEEA
jgi:hypothetical protein